MASFRPCGPLGTIGAHEYPRGLLIVDALTHVTPDGRWFDTAHDATEGNLLRHMDAAGIGHAVVVALAGHVPNDFVIGLAGRHGNRLWPVGGFNPLEWPTTAQVATEAACSYGMRGWSG